jgi:hypothetical protein
VIRGASAFLQLTQFVIAEVSILKRFEGSYSFAEFIAEMSRHGFEAYDILHVGQARPFGDAVRRHRLREPEAQVGCRYRVSPAPCRTCGGPPSDSAGVGRRGSVTMRRTILQ